MFDLEKMNQLNEELRFNEEFEYVMEYANNNDPEAIYQLAMMHMNCEIDNDDLQETLKLLKKAIKLGHKQAKETLNTYYFDLGEYYLEYVINARKEKNHDIQKLFRFLKKANQLFQLAKKYGHINSNEKLSIVKYIASELLEEELS